MLGFVLAFWCGCNYGLLCLFCRGGLFTCFGGGLVGLFKSCCAYVCAVI